MTSSLFERGTARVIPNEEQPPAPIAQSTPTPRNGRHRDRPSLYATDREAEIALLGALLNGADPAIIDPSAWTLPGAQAVHAAVASLHDGRPLDLRLVARSVGNELDRLEIASDVGTVTGEHALAQLDARGPAVSSAPRFAAIVAEQHLLRQLAIHAANAERAILDRDPAEAIAHFERGRDVAANSASPTSWHAIDLGPILSGDAPVQPPTILHRVDGPALVYPGKVNAFNAESETAKTWLALSACVEEIQHERHTIFIDFEDTAHTAVERLLGLGLDSGQIGEYFHYLHPDDPFDIAGQAAIERLLDRTAASLVILDGVTEAMHLHGLSLLDNDDIARFYALLPRRIASHGPGVVDIDHVPKDTTNRKGGIGGQHKRAGVDGVVLKLEPSRPFGRGLHGVARIIVDKDRPGHVRAISYEGKVAGEVHLNATEGYPRLTVEQPPQQLSGENAWQGPTRCMEAVAFLFTDPTIGELSKNAIRDVLRERGIKYRNDVIGQAADQLAADGRLKKRPGPRKSQLFSKADGADGQTLEGVA